MKKKDVISFDFRYKSLNNENIDIIEKKLKKNGVKYRKYEYQKGLFTLTIEKIDKKKFDPTFIKELNETLNIDFKNFDFWACITSSRDMGGFSIPNQIVEYIRIIGANSIEVSYIII